MLTLMFMCEFHVYIFFIIFKAVDKGPIPSYIFLFIVFIIWYLLLKI